MVCGYCKRFPREICIIRTTTLPGESHYPHFRDSESESPGRQLPAAQLVRVEARTRVPRPRVRTRPPRPPRRQLEAQAQLRLGRGDPAALRPTPVSQPLGPRPGRGRRQRPGRGGGGARVCRGSDSLRRKRRLHRRPEETPRRGHLSPSGRDPQTCSSLTHTPRPRGTGLLPNWRLQEAPQAWAAAALT